MVGGSGMYIDAVCKGLDDFPPVPDSIREELNPSSKRRLRCIKRRTYEA